MTFNVTQWHARYRQQAKWTQELRQHILGQVSILSSDLILEVGSGTGAILASLPAQLKSLGLDIDRKSLIFSKSHLPHDLPLLQADGQAIPFQSKTFKVTYCHFLLLWVADPLQVLTEMERVTKRGGAVIAFAEPDYLSREDSPTPLDQLAHYQNDSLHIQGAKIDIGQKISSLFSMLELTNIHVGVLEPPQPRQSSSEDAQLEWRMLQHDLRLLPNQDEFSSLINSAKEVWSSPKRRTYIPCSYAIGYVP